MGSLFLDEVKQTMPGEFLRVVSQAKASLLASG